MFKSILTILLLLGSAVKGQVSLSKYPVLIIISYDGFRYDYLEKTGTPNLDWVKAQGVSVPYMKNQFMTNTFPNHHCISTGLYIESHGVVANSLYDPLYGYLSGYNDAPGFWSYSKNVLPLYALNEVAGDGRHSGVHMWTGSGEPYGDDDTLSTYVQKYDGSIPFEQRIDDVISWVTNAEKPANLIFLYFQEPDSTGHNCGPESPEIVDQIKRMDNVTGYLLDKLRQLEILEKVNLIFTSDHGMQEVKQDEPGVWIDLSLIMDNTNNSKYFNHGSSPVMQLLPRNPDEEQEIYETFKKAAETDKRFTAYLKEETKTLKPDWHYADNRRIMPILLVAEPGYTFDIYTKNGHEKDDERTNERAECATKGQHGYDNAYHTMRPYFMAMGPLFKDGGAVEEPFENIDIYPLVSLIMDLPDHPHNGTFSRICPILKDSYTTCAAPNLTGTTLMTLLVAILSLGIFI